MPYTKQTWTTGETITAQKLNHMEDGIANSGNVFGIEIFENEDDLYQTTENAGVIYQHALNGDFLYAYVLDPHEDEGYDEQYIVDKVDIIGDSYYLYLTNYSHNTNQFIHMKLTSSSVDEPFVEDNSPS